MEEIPIRIVRESNMALRNDQHHDNGHCGNDDGDGDSGDCHCYGDCRRDSHKDCNVEQHDDAGGANTLLYHNHDDTHT